MTVKGIRTIFICCLCFFSTFMLVISKLFFLGILTKMPIQDIHPTKLPRAKCQVWEPPLGVGKVDGWMVGL